MSDRISAQDRALIDEAIAAGRVQHCPAAQHSPGFLEKTYDYREQSKIRARAYRHAQRLREIETQAEVEPTPERSAFLKAELAKIEQMKAEKTAELQRRRAEKKDAKRREAINRRAGEKAIVNAIRDARIIAILKAGGTQMEAAIELKASPMSISRWVKKIRERGEL